MCSQSNMLPLNIKQEEGHALEACKVEPQDIEDTIKTEPVDYDDPETKFSAYNMLNVVIKEEDDISLPDTEISVKDEPLDVSCSIKKELEDPDDGYTVYLPHKDEDSDDMDDETCSNPDSLNDKKRLKSWDTDSMIQAVTAIRRKEMGFNKAEKVFNVPKTSLRRYVSMTNKTPEEAVLTKSGRKPVFSASLEKELIDYLLIVEKRYLGITKYDIRTMAFQLAKRKNLTNNFSALRGAAGKDWMHSFLNRHSNKISIRTVSVTTLSKTKGLCKKDAIAFFDLLGSEFENHSYPPNRIFNADGTGLLISQNKAPKIITLKGKRQINSVTPAESAFLVMTIVCMSADGSYVPPFMIFNKKLMSRGPPKEAPPSTVYSYLQSSWIDSDLFCEWLDHFIYCVKPTESNPVLLVIDGVNKYTRSIELIDKANANHVRIASIPPCSSDKMQPLDVRFMSVLKDSYIREVRIFRYHSGRSVEPNDVPDLFGKACLSAQTSENAVKGFSETGIYPFNPEVFEEVDFAPDEEEEMFEIEAMLEQEMSVDPEVE
ncbi:hypothetical protein C0J52_14094 [Blattella germanica]|nr:hypothetical protein C0J52_14094 [Blattella germanica]